MEVARTDATDQVAPGRFEGVYGIDRWVPIGWMRTGLACALSVGRISNERTDRSIGTGFLLPGGSLDPKLGSERVLLTNSHVISASDEVDKRFNPLRPVEARVDFEGLPPIAGERLSVIWESPPDKEDTAIVRIRNAPEIEGRRDYTPRFRALPQGGRTRIYTIGYPMGQKQSFSLHHSRLLGANDYHLHYRTPTDEGSSGSPLFNQDWELVGIHHYSSIESASLTTPGHVGMNLCGGFTGDEDDATRVSLQHGGEVVPSQANPAESAR